MLKFGFLLAELSYLTLIFVQSVRFSDILEENAENTQKRREKGSFWDFFQTPRPTRKLRTGRVRLLQVEATARLGELLFNLLPSFPINRREGAEVMGSASYIESILLKLVRRRR